ncbi:hemolysin family protein [Legionella pneumophila]|uniref:hemolysin family protein n=1 Tax=Legionella pneumophila TaxID=446 RepID=UPI00086324DA|nr:hemolysin family protein [Legionella pneumophila]AOU64481.1 hypothetical protein A9E90_10290 [Legionella pneumophila]
MYSVLIAFFLFAIFLSFFCSLWEAVLLSISPIYAQIKMREGTFVGKQLQYFKDNIDKPLAAILTLNTFAHTVGAIGVGEQATLIWHDSNPMITGIIVPLVVTLAILILSEIIPKTIGATFWEKLATFTVYSLSVLIKVLYPLVWLCQLTTKMFRSDTKKSIFSRTDFIALAEIGGEQGILHVEESDIIENTLDLYELHVTEVMRPVSDMIMINKDESLDKLIELIKKYRYSRYPVYDSEKNEIIGIMHVKDVFATNKVNEAQSIKELMRPVLKVPHHLPVNNLLSRFREGMPHFALVYDGHNNLVGFITLDNVLHVLLGIIKDEFHRSHVDWVLNNDGTISATGFCSIYSLEQALDIDIEMDENIETLAGLILHHLGRLPEEGEQLQFDAFDVRIEKVQGTRILKITVYPKSPQKSEIN